MIKETRVGVKEKKILSSEDALYVYNLFLDNGIDIWIDGGWGVDALLGRQTRNHGDIDIVVEKSELERMFEILGSKGFKNVPRDDSRAWNFVLGDDDGREIDVHVIVFDENGNGIYGPLENGQMYPAYAFEGVGLINGQEVKCLSPEYQLESHLGYELRDVDYEDVRNLCKKFGLALPSEYGE